MRKSLFLFIMFFCVQIVYSQQLAVVMDKDGRVNVRNKDKQVVDTLPSGEVVCCFEEKDGWVSLYYTTKEGENQWKYYIHKSRLMSLSCLEKIPLTFNSEDKAILQKDSIVITLVQKDFIPQQNKISKENGFVYKINDRKFWGTDGDIPRTEYKSIKISLEKQNVEIPEAAFDDLYEPPLGYTRANYDRVNDILYLHSMNSDGAGGYIVVWVIKKGEYKKRYVYYDF